MSPGTRRTIDGLLAIGPHRLDPQLLAITAYAARTRYALDVFWAILPGEDPASDLPDSGFPIVVFDDEIAGFTREESEPGAPADETGSASITEWHVAYALPQPKTPTTHLPVYGRLGPGETAADAVLYVGDESLDRQLARLEAYAIRSAVRLRGVYVATDAANLRVLLGDFMALNRTRGTGAALTVGPRGDVEIHG